MSNERRRHKRAADKLGISLEEYEAQLAAQSEGETIEEDEPGAGPKAGNARKSAAPKPRKPPKVGKSELMTRMAEHLSTMGAQSLQLLTLRTMGPRGMLAPAEAQGIVQPVGRILGRRVNKVVVLPHMPGDDAEDVTEIAMTVAEYVLRLLSQAMNAWVQRIAGGGAQQQQQTQQQPVATRAATETSQAAYEPEYAPSDIDEVPFDEIDPLMTAGEPMTVATAPVPTNGRAKQVEGAMFDRLASMVSPLGGGED